MVEMSHHELCTNGSAMNGNPITDKTLLIAVDVPKEPGCHSNKQPTGHMTNGHCIPIPAENDASVDPLALPTTADHNGLDEPLATLPTSSGGSSQNSSSSESSASSEESSSEEGSSEEGEEEEEEVSEEMELKNAGVELDLEALGLPSPGEGAPLTLLTEFVSCCVRDEYRAAFILCKKVLEFEPNNQTAQEFLPVLQQRLQLDEELPTESSSDDDSGSDGEDEESQGNHTHSHHHECCSP